MKFTPRKSTRFAREMASFAVHSPGVYPIGSMYSWPAAEHNDVPTYTATPNPFFATPPVSEEARIANEIAELQRNHHFNDAMHYKRLSELRAEQIRLSQQSFRTRFAADVEGEMRRDTTYNVHNPHVPKMRGPRPLGRNRRPFRQGSAVDTDTSFRREPSLMNIDGASYYGPRPQPQRWRHTPVTRGPSIIMEDSSFCIRDCKVQRGGSIRVQTTQLDSAAIAQAALEKEESDRIAAGHAQRMMEALQQRIADERAKFAAEAARLAEEARIAAEAARAAAEAERIAEAARQAEAARLAEEARVAEEARLAEEAREAEEDYLRRWEEEHRKGQEYLKAKRARKARSSCYDNPRDAFSRTTRVNKLKRDDETRRNIGAQRKRREEKKDVAKEEPVQAEPDNSLHARIQRECDAINAEPDATLRAFKLFEYKLDLVKTQYKYIVAAGIKLDVTELPWPIFSPENAEAVILRNDIEPLKAVSAFILHEMRPEAKDVQPRRVVRSEFLRLHPDKFALPMFAVVKQDQLDTCQKLVNAVCSCLNDLYKSY